MRLPDHDILKAVKAARVGSEVVKEVTKAKAAFALLSGSQRRKDGFKPLDPSRIRQLEAQGNTASDWKEILVGVGFDPKYRGHV